MKDRIESGVSVFANSCNHRAERLYELMDDGPLFYRGETSSAHDSAMCM